MPRSLQTPQDVIRYGQQYLDKAGNCVGNMMNRAVQARDDEESIRDLHDVIGALSAVRDSLELLAIRTDERDAEIERLRGELIRETHGHEPGLCDEYRCSSCRYCGHDKPCGCSLAAPEPVEHIKMKCPVCWGETYRKSTDDEGERWEAHYKSSPSCRP